MWPDEYDASDVRAQARAERYRAAQAAKHPQDPDRWVFDDEFDDEDDDEIVRLLTVVVVLALFLVAALVVFAGTKTGPDVPTKKPEAAHAKLG